MYRTIIIISTAMLAICATVLTLWALTRTEALRITTESLSAYNAGRYGVDDDGSPIVEETNAAGMLVEITMDASAATSEDHATSNDAPANAERSPNRAPQRTEQAADAQRRRYDPPAAYHISAPSVPYMINNAPPTAPLFAVTFDGGSFANVAGDILDTLASRNVKSTMFVTGEFIRKFPSVVTRIAAEGHELGNHMNRHPRLTSYSENRRQSTLPNVTRHMVTNELNGAAQLLADRTGLRFAPLWRAPYGEFNQEICRWALDAGYVHIGWRHGRTWFQNLDTNDWVPDESSSAYRTPQEVYEKIVNIAAHPGGLNGGIILMHLGTERKIRSQQVHTILGRLIDTLRAMGYEPVTVSEMLFRTGINVNALALGEKL